MQRSTDRILTTHTGSLPRPLELRRILEGRDQRAARAQPDYAARVEEAVTQAVRTQADIGLDIISDGEMGRVAFSWSGLRKSTNGRGPTRKSGFQASASMPS